MPGWWVCRCVCVCANFNHTVLLFSTGGWGWYIGWCWCTLQYKSHSFSSHFMLGYYLSQLYIMATWLQHKFPQKNWRITKRSHYMFITRLAYWEVERMVVELQARRLPETALRDCISTINSVKPMHICKEASGPYVAMLVVTKSDVFDSRDIVSHVSVD